MDDTIADELLTIPACVLGPWLAALVAQYKDLDGGLRSVVFKAVITSHAGALHVTNAKLECFHAILRRHLEMRGARQRRWPL